MDTWIDEGLSAAAEYVYSESYEKNRIDWFNENGSSGITSSINLGNNFFVWGNRGIENPYAVLDDYSTVYLFFQWLRLQSDVSQNIYKKIISSENSDWKAVTDAAKESIDPKYDNNWGLLLRDWLAANYINAPDGIYGYKNEPLLKTIKAPYAPADTTISLAQGEGVYSVSRPSNLSLINSNSPNIKYATLKAENSPEDISGTYTANSGTLLTYNVNTTKTYYWNDEISINEDGTITGITASLVPAASEVSASRSVSPELPGPFPIGAQDMLRQRGRGNESGAFNYPSR